MTDYRLIDVARANYALVEALYERYQRDPKSVTPEWIEVFKTLEMIPATPQAASKTASSFNAPNEDRGAKSYRIRELINAYRRFGYLGTTLDPIALKKTPEPMHLNLEHLGFSEKELSQLFPTCGFLDTPEAPLLEIINALKKTYAGRIGFEYMDYLNPELESYVQNAIEPSHLEIPLKIAQKQMILEQLNKSELLESFLHTKFTGQKRFSIEGGETLIPMLSAIIEKSADLGAKEFVIGMAHRGRLNVLANILNKSYTELFSEFDEGYFPDSFEGSGDVKYHRGFLSEVLTFHGHQVKASLTPNPSHLESVDPVVEGQVKAKQVKLKDEAQKAVIALLVHGDAALSGQGVVYETLQLGKLKGYSTGGTVHIVVNNQIGFTTLPSDGRSTLFCTDIAKVFFAPVLHVNAEDPEACVYAAILAADLRDRFHVDVFIELNCYRKYGHNEGDEPAFTQPLEYQLIRAKKPIRELYRDALIHQGVVEKFMAEGLEAEFKKALQNAQRAIKPIEKKPPVADPKLAQQMFNAIETGVKAPLLREIAEHFCQIPPGFTIHAKLDHLLKERLAMVIKSDHQKAIDWGMAEILAYSSLLWNGIHLRLSGQDVGRGTFSHRHALWMDQAVEKAYYPLSHLKDGQGRADVINSPLSEFAALAFEYGYSVAYPEALVIWEAQFGDFGNGGQVVIDQYITSAEQKWGQKSALTLYLPHGYEGQGPEHSSARVERFLSLAGNDNMFICNPSTPAQFFHLIRRQALSPLKKPLICLTPKVLLRHPDCVSTLEDFEKGHFKEVIDDPEHPKAATRVLFCNGKIYYELNQLRLKDKLNDIAIIRIEQLYPLNEEAVRQVLLNYKKAAEFMWVQEEPKNMGAWTAIAPLLESLLPNKVKLEYVGRPQSAATATGSYALHKKELAEIFARVATKKKGANIEIAHFHRA